ncbi:MAG: YggT family protein [Candidatus Marinimicrobia bacterium]|nr:YggT family protein [Candidatus Neomarinimicrobiota bacterium]
MVIIANLLIALGKILDLIISIGYIVFIVRAIISWVEVDDTNQFVQMLYKVTEPVLEPVRRYLPGGMIDFSPMAVLVMLYFTDMFVVETLLDIGFRLK